MGITDVPNLTCDCCGYSTQDVGTFLSLTIQKVLSPQVQDTKTYTFCFQNNCAPHVGPIAQYMVQQSAQHHATVANAQNPPQQAKTYVHPPIEITLMDDKGVTFANATSPI